MIIFIIIFNLYVYSISYVANAPFCAQRPPENAYFEKTCLFWGGIKSSPETQSTDLHLVLLIILQPVSAL